jgi:hypothetical protein
MGGGRLLRSEILARRPMMVSSLPPFFPPFSSLPFLPTSLSCAIPYSEDTKKSVGRGISPSWAVKFPSYCHSRLEVTNTRPMRSLFCRLEMRAAQLVRNTSLTPSTSFSTLLFFQGQIDCALFTGFVVASPRYHSRHR